MPDTEVPLRKERLHQFRHWPPTRQQAYRSNHRPVQRVSFSSFAREINLWLIHSTPASIGSGSSHSFAKAQGAHLASPISASATSSTPDGKVIFEFQASSTFELTVLGARHVASFPSANGSSDRRRGRQRMAPMSFANARDIENEKQGAVMPSNNGRPEPTLSSVPSLILACSTQMKTSIVA